MAKKVNSSKPVVDVTPGANPHESNNPYGRKLGNILGAVCLLVFIIFDELWIGNLACAFGFAVIFFIQVFHLKTHKWYTSPYLYASILTFVLAYAEYRFDFLTELLKIG